MNMLIKIDQNVSREFRNQLIIFNNYHGTTAILNILIICLLFVEYTYSDISGRGKTKWIDQRHHTILDQLVSAYHIYLLKLKLVNYYRLRPINIYSTNIYFKFFGLSSGHKLISQTKAFFHSRVGAITVAKMILHRASIFPDIKVISKVDRYILSG